MSDFGINEMLDMQRALQERYKDKWEGISSYFIIIDNLVYRV